MKMKTTLTGQEFYDVSEIISKYERCWREDVLKKEFSQWDKNNNGYIDGKELNFLAVKYGERFFYTDFRDVRMGGIYGPDLELKDEHNQKVAEEVAEKILIEFDKDKNGKIDLEEFKKILLRIAYMSTFGRVSVRYWNRGENKGLKIEKFKETFKRYLQFIKEFSEVVSLEMIKIDQKNENKEEPPEDFEVRFKKSPYLVYTLIIEDECEFAEPKLELPIDELNRKYEMKNNPEKYFGKIREYASLLEKIEPFFENYLKEEDSKKGF